MTELLTLVKDQQEKIRLLLNDMGKLNDTLYKEQCKEKPDRLFTTKDVKVILGYKTISAVNKLIGKGLIKPFKRGRANMIYESELNAFIERNSTPAYNEQKHHFRGSRRNMVRAAA
ncbi:MAG TPA: helix-turn-helix domain-containing protein [Cyclobacteriaceae bacterium]